MDVFLVPFSFGMYVTNERLSLIDAGLDQISPLKHLFWGNQNVLGMLSFIEKYPCSFDTFF